VDGDVTVWVFSGHGSQWAGMGRELEATEPEFARVLDELEPVFVEEIGFAPRQALLEDNLRGVDRIQPLIFAMQTGLAAVWQSHGVRPAAVIGHSVGEIAAAVTAGVFGLADGARLICRRSALLRRAAGKGAMVLVRLPMRLVQERLGDRTDVVAAIEASPVLTVVAGDPPGVRRLTGQWRAEGVPVLTVGSDVAFHSPQMDPLLDGLAAAVRDLVPARPAVPIYTTALSDPRADVVRDSSYWVANLRNPVRLATAVAAAAEDGHRVFLEVSPHPVVASSIMETLSGAGVEDAFVTGTLRRNQPEHATLLASLKALSAV
jgi:6-methylsalicylic acid synthase